RPPDEGAHSLMIFLGFLRNNLLASSNSNQLCWWYWIVDRAPLTFAKGATMSEYVFDAMAPHRSGRSQAHSLNILAGFCYPVPSEMHFRIAAQQNERRAYPPRRRKCASFAVRTQYVENPRN